MKEFLNRLSSLFLILTLISCTEDKDRFHFYSLAEAEFKSENYQEAINFLSIALDKDSTFANAYFFRANILVLLQVNRDSICLDLSKAQKFGHPEAAQVIQTYCSESNKSELNRRMAQLDSIIESTPLNYEGYIDRADLYFDHQMFVQAIDDYSKVIELNNHPTAFFNRGLCFIQIGKKQDGCADIKKSAELGYKVEVGILSFCGE